MLNNAERALLRKEGHKIDKPYLLGKGEVDADFMAMIDAALSAKELIKVKLLTASSLDIKEVAASLCRNLHCETVFIIGHTALLYRQSKKRIYLK